MEKLTKKRKPLTAAILTIIVFGLGQIYNGQIIKGILFFFISLLIPLTLGLFGLQFSFYGLIIMIVIVILVIIFIVGDAFYTSKKVKEIVMGPLNKWYYYFLIILVSLGSHIIIRDYFNLNILAIKSYEITGKEMNPNLMIGDRIIVNLRYYKKNSPSKGDIVIYQRPQTQSDYIGRIVATENDTIESRGKIIYINGKVLNESYIQHEDEKIVNNKRDNFGPVTVQKSSIFVLGDNRDKSYDSRFFGTVNVNKIKGKFAYIYWGRGNHVSKGIRGT